MAVFYTTALGKHYDVYGPDGKQLAERIFGSDMVDVDWPIGSEAWDAGEENFKGDPHVAVEVETGSDGLEW